MHFKTNLNYVLVIITKFGLHLIIIVIVFVEKFRVFLEFWHLLFYPMTSCYGIIPTNTTLNSSNAIVRLLQYTNFIIKKHFFLIHWSLFRFEIKWYGLFSPKPFVAMVFIDCGVLLFSLRLLLKLWQHTNNSRWF